MKREALFEGIIHENGDLALVITYAGIGNWMPVDFWKRLIRIFDDKERRDKRINGEDLVRLEEVVALLKQGVAHQERLEASGIGLPYWLQKFRKEEKEEEE